MVSTGMMMVDPSGQLTTKVNRNRATFHHKTIISLALPKVLDLMHLPKFSGGPPPLETRANHT